MTEQTIKSTFGLPATGKPKVIRNVPAPRSASRERGRADCVQPGPVGIMNNRLITTAAFAIFCGVASAEDLSPSYGQCLIMPEEWSTIPKQARRVWIEFNASLKKKEWEKALSCCSTNVQQAAAASTNDLKTFFQPFIARSALTVSGTIRVGGKPVYVSGTNVPSCIPLTTENGEWKITFPVKREKKIPTKPIKATSQ